MKKFSLIVVLGVMAGLASFQAKSQDLQKGTCVMGLTKKMPDRIVFVRPVKVYDSARDVQPRQVMKYYEQFRITVIENSRAKLVYASNVDDENLSGKFYGWVNLIDLSAMADHHCV